MGNHYPETEGFFVEAEGYLSRPQLMAHIFETAEREDWSDEKLSRQVQGKLRIKDGALKQIMRVYRAYKDDDKITEAQWREVLNAWRNDEASMTGPYNALRCYEAAKEVERTLRRYEGISVQWKTSGDYNHTVMSVEGYLELRESSADLIAAIEEILEEEGWYITANARDFLEKRCKTEKYLRSVFS